MNNPDSMVEKVARSIAVYGGRDPDGGHAGVFQWQAYEKLARAAIAAMREPTDAVMQAGCASNPPGNYHAGTTLRDIIGAEWRAMIDAALTNTAKTDAGDIASDDVSKANSRCVCGTNYETGEQCIDCGREF